MLLYVWNVPPDSPYRSMTGVEDAPSLDALLASVLAGALEQRLRIGLGCDYMPEARLLRGVRGRIDLTGSLKQRAFEKGQAYCKFEEFSTNAPKNQIVRSTLHFLVRAGEFGPENADVAGLRHRLRRLVRALEGADLIELAPETIARQLKLRHDPDYRIMLAICDFIVRRRMPTEQTGQIFMTRLERERHTLHRLYQDFVASYYRHHLQGWHVASQHPLAWHAEGSHAHLPQMRPDLILTEHLPSGRIIVLDTKFTAKSLILNQWGQAMFDSSHLYQIYAYLKTQEHVSAQHKQATGILLYPSIDEELSEQIALPGQAIRIETVNLAAGWGEIEERLMALIVNEV